jgi:putative DNA primase/helicase
MTVDVIRQWVLPRLDKVRPSNGGFMARCPAHEDRSASLSVAPGRDQPVVLHCHTGICRAKDIADAAGIPWDVISKRRDDKPADDAWMPCSKRDGHHWTATYRYNDQHGAVVLGVARCSQKCFAQWRPEASKKTGRAWSLTLPDGTKAGAGIPYRLPELLASAPDVVYVVEGEKDVETLRALGLTSTCNAGGGGKWTEAHAQWLAGRDVIVIADRDLPGQQHALHVVETLMPIALSIDIAQATRGKDVSDHLAAGQVIDGLARIHTPKAHPAEMSA